MVEPKAKYDSVAKLVLRKPEAQRRTQQLIL
jgi:hypothetical protein